LTAKPVLNLALANENIGRFVGGAAWLQT